MKDLLDSIVRALPNYVDQLLGVFRAPKQFFDGRDVTSSQAVKDGLIFLGVSWAIILIAQTPDAGTDLATSFAPRTAGTLFALLVMVGTLQLCWLAVGGKASLKSTFVISCYMVGVAGLVTAMFSLVGFGLFKIIDREHYEQFRGNELADYFSDGVKIWGAVTLFGFSAACAWLCVAWGAYRTANGVSKARSAVAFTLANTLGLAVAVIPISLGVFYERQSPTNIPPELLGRWKANSTSDGVVLLDDYIFDSRSSYFSVNRLVSNVTCRRSETRSAYGRFRIEETKLILRPAESKRHFVDSCRGEWDEPGDRADVVLYYRIDRRPEGWALCLEGRDGARCLVPAEPLSAK